MPTLQQRRLILAERSFSPLDLPGLKLWLDASQITGLVDGDPVATWSDLSGQGNHATQATASKRPTYKVSIVNGRPVVRFDGVDDLLDSAGLTLVQPNTVFVVGSMSGGLCLLDSASTTREFIGGRATHSTYSLYCGTADIETGLNDRDTSPHVFTAVAAGASSFLAKDGTSGVTGDAGSGAFTGVRIGATVIPSQFLNQDVAEVVICSGVLNSAARSRTQRYLGTKYGIAVS